jgi:hypothetical protein
LSSPHGEVDQAVVTEARSVDSVTITGTGFMGGVTVTDPTGVKCCKAKVISSTRITATGRFAWPEAGMQLSLTVVNGVGGDGVRTGRVLTSPDGRDRFRDEQSAQPTATPDPSDLLGDEILRLREALRGAAP